MTKFGLDQMPAVEIQLTCEILGDIRDAERDAVTSTPSYGNAARYLVRRIKDVSPMALKGLLGEAAHHMTRVGSSVVWFFLICIRFSTSANVR